MQAGKTKPFRVMTEKDEMVILPWTMAHDIRNNSDLGFNPFISKVSISMLSHRHAGLVAG